jgi:hypothetical protein
MDTTPFNAASPVEPTFTQIASRDWAGQWRHHFVPNDPDSSHQPISDWIAMVEGEMYPLRATQTQWTGGEFLTVGLEYEEADSSAHYHANRMIQKFEISHTNVAEEWELTIDNPDNSKYTLLFVNNQGAEPITWRTDEISKSASASSFSGIVDWWFWKYHRSGISVTRTSYDADGLETSDSSLTVRYVYNVKLSKRING